MVRRGVGKDLRSSTLVIFRARGRRVGRQRIRSAYVNICEYVFMNAVKIGETAHVSKIDRRNLSVGVQNIHFKKKAIHDCNDFKLRQSILVKPH